VTGSGAPRRRAVLLGLAGAAAARAGLAGAAALTARPAGAPWRRKNYAGRPVTLLGGPALAAAATSTAVLAAPRGWRAAAGLVGAAAGLAGAYDDLAGARPEQAHDKGLTGHLRAVRAGRLSAGAVKVLGIGSAAALAGGLTSRAGGRRLADAALTTGLVAGGANLVNLLDLRPGRAAKVVALAGVATLGGPAGGLVAGPTGGVLAVLPADLAERVMLGDCGANAAGALIGLRLSALRSRTGRAALLAGVVGLTLASEKVSFTRVIAATPVLRELDRLGRRPAP
jgi:UDP-N-acetylmuramyl pentapeptide phosphotransferase/UDP-N-acetylglucosamine-1-phosphate transferase